jgi:DNA polymerase-3 subunit alpha
MSDFARRLNPRDVNKKVLESLAAAGAFDALEPNRARVFHGVEKMLALANRAQEDVQRGQAGLFAGDSAMQDRLELPAIGGWTSIELLQREFDAIGYFISGHPLEAYGAVLNKLRVVPWVEFVRSVKRGASAGRLAATVLDRAERRTKSGSKMGIVTLSDQSGQYEAILFQEGLNQYRDMLEKGMCVLVGLQANVEGEDVRARIVSVELLDKAAHRVQKGLRIFVRDEAPLSSIAQRLTQKGEGEVALVLMLDQTGGEVELRLRGKYQVTPTLAAAIKAVPGVVSVEHV